MASLTPLSGNLDLRKAKHLLRRATFNYTKNQLDVFTSMSATEAVDTLTIDAPYALQEPYDPLPEGSPDGFWTSATTLPRDFEGQTRKRALVAGWWWYNAINQVSLKHKLSFFLHTCFTVSKDGGSGAATYFYDYLRLLDFYALGNIKTLAKKITLDSSMLYYLDNHRNNKYNPNENYAREYLELFTILRGEQIGPGNYTNYTEEDIQEAAKVFSGFKIEENRSIIDPDTGIPMGYVNFEQHNSDNKTFSNAFNNQTIIGRETTTEIFEELDDFVEMVFAQQETAKAYCRKLYRYFVKSKWDDEVEADIITPLADLLIANDFEIVPVVRTLLSSQHFYDADDSIATDETIGSIIKSPLQLVSEICSLFNASIPNSSNNPLEYYHIFFKRFIHDNYFVTSGMDLFSPFDVAGYHAYFQEPDFDRYWFSSNTIIGRYSLIESLIQGVNTISSGEISATIDTVLFVRNNITGAQDPNVLVSEMANLLYPEAIDADRVNYFKQFLVEDGFPDYYWTGIWNRYLNDNDNFTVKTRIDALVTAMINAAEFQLM
ncbi:DUF1800 domain-containing protein [Tenacibaculum geojense]|uniref:DUF1800 family protein n=1 Tax=Tenacibaculum geojense TaxID=915352 RepID=A0ABW3JQY9_9FLAO